MEFSPELGRSLGHGFRLLFRPLLTVDKFGISGINPSPHHISHAHLIDRHFDRSGNRIVGKLYRHFVAARRADIIAFAIALAEYGAASYVLQEMAIADRIVPLL